MAQLILNPNPARIVGHPTVTASTNQPNLVEGRELSGPYGVAVDASSGAVFVADTGNNRVLGWSSLANLRNGMAADIVLGQRDKYSTSQQGPGSGFNVGLAFPVGLAVDASGNLYVADAGNNRILRYPRPFAQRVDVYTPDLVIGQPEFNTGGANAGGLSAKSLFTAGSGVVYYVGLAFDRNGALWVSDAGNNRVLRYPSEVLRAGSNGPAADFVLGQPDFITNRPVQAPEGVFRPSVKDGMLQPAGLAFDGQGRLYVVDSLNRVLVFTPPFDRNGKPASRILGAGPTGRLPLTTVSPYTIGTRERGPAQSLFILGDVPYVLDGPANRILRFDPPERWPSEESSFSPPAVAVFGQPDFISSEPNRGQAEPGAGTFASPAAACVAGSDVLIADSGNHRVLVFRGGNLEAASVVLGQEDFAYNSQNLIEGREFFFAPGAISGASLSIGLAVDNTTETPGLYVADVNNNRVLWFRDIRQLRAGSRADLVIGQSDGRDFYRALVNFPTNKGNQRSETGLFAPAGVVVDPEGNLWVADTGNSRVLRYPRPSAQTGPIRPNLVLGQSSFTTRVTDATSSTMAAPVSLAFTSDGNLLVCDAVHARVLYFMKPPGGDFTNGQPAAKVFGRDDFTSAPAANPDHRLSNPRGIAVDVDDRLYVADMGNNRVLIYDRIPAVFGTTAPPAYSLTGVRSPFAVAVGPGSGEIWVADTLGNRVVRYPSYVSLVFDQRVQDAVASRTPMGLAVDGFGNVIVAEGVNRLAMFYPAIAAKNAASYHDRRGLAPGMIASLFPPSETQCRDNPFYRPRFSDSVAVFDPNVQPFRLPVELGDVSVVVNGTPAPMYFATPCQINFLVPNYVPADNRWSVEVIRPSTGQILAYSLIPFAPASPAFFTSDASGKGQIAALNQDGTRNSESNRAPYGSVVSLFGTGAGFIQGAPPDGEPAPSDRLVRTAETPTVIIGTQQATVQFSGLAPGLVGVWQLNVVIPDRTSPTAPVPVAVLIGSTPSNRGPGDAVIQTTIWVKQP
jgi:uncharacterized protein (TIGR03437 family)